MRDGPRIASSATEIIGAIPRSVYVGPYEDVRLKEQITGHPCRAAITHLAATRITWMGDCLGVPGRLA